MSINRIRKSSLVVLIAVLVILAATLTSSILRSREKEESEKIAVLEGIASGLAPSVWGYFDEMAKTILDDFVLREQHPYLVIFQSNGDVFYYHRVSPPGKLWLYRTGIKTLRSLELPIYHEDFPIAVVRTDYVSSNTIRNLTLALVMTLAALSAILIRRIVIVSVLRSRALTELKEAQKRIVSNDRVLFFSLLSMKLAHEFNTPLGIIITAQSFLAENNPGSLSDIESRKMLNLIGDSAKKMKNLIRRMQVSVPESGEEELSLTSVKNAIAGVVIALKKDGDEISLDVPETLTWNLRKNALTLVLEELANNASRHGRRDDGKLELTISVTVDNSVLVIVLKDCGKGIPEHMENLVFSPFTTAQPMQKGSGLGLYLAMNYTVKFLDGSLSYVSRESGGAEFILKIPLAGDR